jgi:hypothetical protein
MSYLRCSVRLYLQLFVGGLISYLRYLCLFVSSLPPVVCRSAHVLFTMFGSSLPTVVCRSAHFLFTMFGSSLPPVVCRRADVLFTLFVFVCFVFTSSCL